MDYVKERGGAPENKQRWLSALPGYLRVVKAAADAPPCCFKSEATSPINRGEADINACKLFNSPTTMDMSASPAHDDLKRLTAITKQVGPETTQ